MDLAQRSRAYIHQMISKCPGIKCMLTDEDTTKYFGAAAGWRLGELRQLDLQLSERIESTFPTKLDVNAIVFVRPTLANIEHIIKHLRKPQYGEYYIFFTSILPVGHLEKLANEDQFSVIKMIEEAYLDFVVCDPWLFSLDVPYCLGNDAADWRAGVSSRCRDGLFAAVSALDIRPVIRYQASSNVCSDLAQRLCRLTGISGVDTSATLLIIDRRDDVITPLLMPFTYQAAVHELFGISAKKVETPVVEGEAVLDSSSDQFFLSNMFKTFPEVMRSQKVLTEVTKKHQRFQQTIDNQSCSLQDIKGIVDELSKFEEEKTQAITHTNLLLEITRMLDRRLIHADEFSILTEQAHILLGNAQREHQKMVDGVLGDRKLAAIDRIRLVLLLILKYESSRWFNVDQYCGNLVSSGLHRRYVDIATRIVAYGGSGSKACSNTAFKRVSNDFLKSDFEKSMDEFCHSPVLAHRLEKLSSGRLGKENYPLVDAHTAHDAVASASPKKMIIFIVGGATYEEAKAVARFNAAMRGSQQVVLGGTTVHNTESFLAEVAEAFNIH